MTDLKTDLQLCRMTIQLRNRFARLIAFLSWIKKAKTVDHLDSPYLFNFYKNVVVKKSDDSNINNIELLRSKYLQDNTLINVTDYGAGSSFQQGALRSIKQIACTAVSSKAKCNLLYNLVQFYKVTDILELGTSLGISGLYLQAGNLNAKVTSVEGDPALFEITKRNDQFWAKNLQLINSKFDSFLEDHRSLNSKYDLVFIDGGHTSDQLLPILKNLDHVITSSTILIIDDIYWSKDMKDTWHKIKSDGKYNVAIDLWYFGILCSEAQIKEPIDICLSPLSKRWKPGLFR